MDTTPTVRPEAEADHPIVREVHRLAFGRDGEADLVDALRAGGHARVSLVAEVGGEVVGHVLFSLLPILTETGVVPALSLAPVAVRPEGQRRGVGSALVRRGLEVCREQGHRIVVVLGHPEYYPRFGFSAGLAEPLRSPFDAGNAWMAAELTPGALAGVEGWVEYPPPFGIGPYVRPAYPTDAPEWVRLRSALWPDGGAHADEVAIYFGTRPDDRGDPAAVFMAVRPTGGLCGVVEVSLRSVVEGCGLGPVGYIEGWFVDPDWRRRGVGRQLLAAAERWAATRGCREIGSDAHLDNTDSLAAHRSLGYEETERLVHFRKRLADSPREVSGPRRLTLLGVPGRFAVCRLPAGSPVPGWAAAGDLFAVTRTADELSVVCSEGLVPAGVVSEPGWRGLRVAGAMPFTLVGVLASLTAPVARAGVGVFAFSTFDTDYLLVKADDFARTVAALRSAGHRVDLGEGPP